MKQNTDNQVTEPHRRFLDEFSGLWPLAKGSLSEVRKPCVRKGCKVCAAEGGHAALIFTYREGGRHRCLHVRPEHETHIREAIANGRKIEAALTRLGRETVLRCRQQP